MLEIFLNILGSILVLYFIATITKETAKVLSSLGIKDIRNYPFSSFGYIEQNNLRLRVEFYTTDYGKFLSIESLENIETFMIFRTGDLLNFLLYPKSVGFARVEYDDAQSFNKILLNQEFLNTLKELFTDRRLYSVELQKKKLKLVFHFGMGYTPTEQDLKDIIDMLNRVRSIKLDIRDSISTHRMRSLLGFYTPTIFLSSLLIFSLFLPGYNYRYVCPKQAIFYSSIGIFYIIFLYFYLVVWRFSNLSNFISTILKGYIGYICAFFLNFSLVPFINGYFDTSDYQYRHDTIAKKVLVKSTELGDVYKVKLSKLHAQKPWCATLKVKVSDEFHNSLSIGSEVFYRSKSGRLGLEWFDGRLYVR
ncbi:MAG: hypothetical protein ABDH18_06190 [Aquificaceae bacterium]